MTLIPPFDARSAIADAYGTLPAGLERLVVPIAVWSGVGLLAVPLADALPQFLMTIDLRAAVRMLYLTAYTEMAVLLAASLSITVAWHRWIILGEKQRPVFPRRSIAASYVLPFALIFFLPFILVPVVLDALLAALGQTLQPVLYDIASYFGSALLAAGVARYSLVLAARASEDDLSLHESWSLTTGGTWPLFWGMLACRLPLGGVAIWLSEVTTTFAEGTPGYVGFYYLGSFVEMVTDAVSSAFIAFAYLHFTRDRPSPRDPARHFA